MTRTIEDLIPDYLRGLPVYVPGKPIEEVERELKIHAVKLASNENPLGPSPKGMRRRGRCWEIRTGIRMAGRTLCGKRWRNGGSSPEEILWAWDRAKIIDLAARVCCVRDAGTDIGRDVRAVFGGDSRERG